MTNNKPVTAAEWRATAEAFAKRAREARYPDPKGLDPWEKWKDEWMPVGNLHAEDLLGPCPVDLDWAAQEAERAIIIQHLMSTHTTIWFNFGSPVPVDCDSVTADRERQLIDCIARGLRAAEARGIVQGMERAAGIAEEMRDAYDAGTEKARMAIGEKYSVKWFSHITTAGIAAAAIRAAAAKAVQP